MYTLGATSGEGSPIVVDSWVHANANVAGGLKVSDQLGSDELFDQWCTYEKVVANDYMHQREFFAVLQRDLYQRFNRPLAVVDIGCGDGVPIAPLLNENVIRKYVGIDQSQSALTRAARNLANCPHSLFFGDMLEQLGYLEGPFDVAVASFSLHHLERSAKEDVLGECRRLLTDDGVVAVIDIFLEEQEGLDHYHDRWERNARNFSALTEQELEQLLDHVRRHDHPEPLSQYLHMGRQAGFRGLTELAVDEQRLNRLIVMYAN